MRVKRSRMQSAARVIAGLAVAVSLLWLTGAVRAQQKSAACKVVESAVFANRIHVRCEYPVDGKFLYFAAPTADPDPKFVNRVLSVILLAQQSGKVVNIEFDPLIDPVDFKGRWFGCNSNNCRRILAILLDDGTQAPPPPALPPPPQPSTANRNCVSRCRVAFDACMGAASGPTAKAGCREVNESCQDLCPTP